MRTRDFAQRPHSHQKTSGHKLRRPIDPAEVLQPTMISILHIVLYTIHPHLKLSLIACESSALRRDLMKIGEKRRRETHASSVSRGCLPPDSAGSSPRRGPRRRVVDRVLPDHGECRGRYAKAISRNRAVQRPLIAREIASDIVRASPFIAILPGLLQLVTVPCNVGTKPVYLSVIVLDVAIIFAQVLALIIAVRPFRRVVVHPRWSPRNAIQPIVILLRLPLVLPTLPVIYITLPGRVGAI